MRVFPSNFFSPQIASICRALRLRVRAAHTAKFGRQHCNGNVDGLRVPQISRHRAARPRFYSSFSTSPLSLFLFLLSPLSVHLSPSLTPSLSPLSLSLSLLPPSLSLPPQLERADETFSNIFRYLAHRRLAFSIRKLAVLCDVTLSSEKQKLGAFLADRNRRYVVRSPLGRGGGSSHRRSESK